MTNKLKILWRAMFVLLALLSNAPGSQAQDKTDQEDVIAVLRSTIEKSKYDTNRVNLLLKLSRSYFSIKYDMDSSLLYAQQALLESRNGHFERHVYRSMMLLGGVLSRRGEISRARPCIDTLVAYYRRQGNLKGEADLYVYMGKLIPMVDNVNIPAKKALFEKAISLFKQNGLFREEIEARNLISRIHLEDGKTDLAEKEFNEQLAYAKSKGTGLKLIYLGLADVARSRGDLAKKLFYYLELLKICETQENNLKNMSWRNYLYNQLAAVYGSLKQYEESDKMSRKAMALSREVGDGMYYQHLQTMAKGYLSRGKNHEVLELAQKAAAEAPPQNAFDRNIINSLMGKSYLNLHQLEKATPYYIELEKYAGSMNKEFNTLSILNSYQANYYLDLADFFIASKKYDKAQAFIDKTNQLKGDSLQAVYRIVAMNMQIRIDTAKHDFYSAFIRLEQFKRINDSINTSENNRAVANLMIKYQSEKKDQDLILRQRDIDLLTQQQEIQKARLLQADLEISLQEQRRLQQEQLNALESEKRERDLKIARYDLESRGNRIALLSKQAQIQAASLKNTELMRNMTIFGLVLTIIITALLYRGYHVKKDNNKKLTLQKNEIDSKNQSLQKLVTEKEWLLKELHHRVKNNLQIVMGLLKMQSFYLEDSPALLAIKETQHRVHSISLIHKKLYLGENVGLIHMPAYIHELVDDLKRSFTTAQQVQFQVDVADISLDASKAAPLGLILNEAITNSIKYAFPADRGGNITVAMRRKTHEKVNIIISDDGIGLPADFSDNLGGSLGMSLIQGLSSEIDGVCSITSFAGTSIDIEFPCIEAPQGSGVMEGPLPVNVNFG